ncbi:hypothetical protein BLNAU_15555 [Blattamonas nauphoetae]|uniref:Proteasome assembly chaperone 2 n=1 Tax=Blattamonas nauphoetae TaxID=2049346 RepID=A0ABQ9XFQ7_9EUKA|nr:hypothetical protein BLNAU_15555 [Blattamonas nauphoetae]
MSLEYFGTLPSELSISTLLVGTISSNWVSTASLDALIFTHKMSRLGIFESDYMIPHVSSVAAPYGIMSELELFFSPSLSLAILQLRGVPIKGCLAPLMESISQWVFSQKFGKIILLSGAEKSRNPTEHQQEGFQFVYLQSLFEDERHALAKEQWKSFEPWRDTGKVPGGSGTLWALQAGLSGFSAAEMKQCVDDFTIEDQDGGKEKRKSIWKQKIEEKRKDEKNPKLNWMTLAFMRGGGGQTVLEESQMIAGFVGSVLGLPETKYVTPVGWGDPSVFRDISLMF